MEENDYRKPSLDSGSVLELLRTKSAIRPLESNTLLAQSSTASDEMGKKQFHSNKSSAHSQFMIRTSFEFIYSTYMVDENATVFRCL